MVDALILQQAEQVARIEAVLEHQGAAGIEPEDAGHPHPRDVVDGHHVKHSPSVHRPVLVLDGRSGQKRPVADHRRPGAAGGAGGEDQHRGLVGVDGAPDSLEVVRRNVCAGGQKLVRRHAVFERPVQRHHAPDRRVVAHQRRQLPGVVAAVDAAEGDQHRRLGEIGHVPELGQPVARVVAGPHRADLGLGEHDRQPFGRRRRQRRDPFARGHVGCEQRAGPAGDDPIEVAVGESCPAVHRGFAAGLACGMEADALADPAGVDGQGDHALRTSGVIRGDPPW